MAAHQLVDLADDAVDRIDQIIRERTLAHAGDESLELPQFLPSFLEFIPRRLLGAVALALLDPLGAMVISVGCGGNYAVAFGWGSTAGSDLPPSS